MKSPFHPRFYFFIPLLVLALISEYALADTNDPHYAMFESFALSTTPEQMKFPISTFVPRSMLLYNISEAHPESLKEKYYSAETQDGVKVFILKNTVSEKSFKEQVGNHEIIFNARASLCRKYTCEEYEDDQLIPIDAGFALKIIDTDDNGFHLVEFSKDNKIFTGYIEVEKLKELEKRGIVTRADQAYPKYKITKRLSKILNTGCGEKKAIGDKLLIPEDGLAEVDRKIMETLNLGTLDSGLGLVKLKKDYGETEQKFNFALYDIEHLKSGNKKTIVAQIIYECNQVGAAQEKLIRTLRADLIDSERGPYDLLPVQTPPDLIQYTGSPYLFSVNNYKHYEELMDRLAEKFEDRSLAGFFISEFNRSCKSRFRKDSKCRNHSYLKQQ